MSKIKSTKSLGYSLKGYLELDDMKVVEITEEEEVAHDLQEILEQFKGKEVSISIKMTDKLGDE